MIKFVLNHYPQTLILLYEYLINCAIVTYENQMNRLEKTFRELNLRLLLMWQHLQNREELQAILLYKTKNNDSVQSNIT